MSRKRQRPDKASCQIRHAKKRALERYSVTLNRHDINQIVADIQKGRAEFIKKQSNRLAVFKVESQGAEMFSVYDRNRKSIATFLTEDMVIDNDWVNELNCFEQN